MGYPLENKLLLVELKCVLDNVDLLLSIGSSRMWTRLCFIKGE